MKTMETKQKIIIVYVINYDIKCNCHKKYPKNDIHLLSQMTKQMI
jgi:hypothetical protein